jgi:pseudouridine-5'-phosphate glycosidase
MYPPPPLDIRPDVAAALQAGQPVVAFASAPIAHSLSWPENLEIARLAIAAARQAGAILAVVAVWRGRLTVGLTDEQLETLTRGGDSFRASRRDLPMAIVRQRTASTTVSASMYLAQRAGISLLAAGAIGGAGPGSSGVWDVSADLVELSRTPVAVVNAGARSVLDLARTAEILESYRVPVVGYGTDSFPAFYQRPGSQAASVRVDTPADAAALLATHWGMGGAGVVLALPTPDAVAMSPDVLQPALQEVARLAAQTGVRAKDLPPLMMDRLNGLTKGRALRAYRVILEANSRLAAQVARELTALVKTSPGTSAGGEIRTDGDSVRR